MTDPLGEMRLALACKLERWNGRLEWARVDGFDWACYFSDADILKRAYRSLLETESDLEIVMKGRYLNFRLKDRWIRETFERWEIAGVGIGVEVGELELLDAGAGLFLVSYAGYRAGVLAKCLDDGIGMEMEGFPRDDEERRMALGVLRTPEWARMGRLDRLVPVAADFRHWQRRGAVPGRKPFLLALRWAMMVALDCEKL